MGSPERAVALPLLLAGRLIGEVAQRLGQPAVIGQRVAGILLGPPVFDALAPEAYRAVS